MKAIVTETLNKEGKEVYWHYHMIGTGVIAHYNLIAMQIMMTCEHTGQLIGCYDFYEQDGISKEDFLELCESSYKTAIEKGSTVYLDYMDNPTIVGCIGVDLDLLKN